MCASSVKCLDAECPIPELPKDLQTKQNQNQAKREILENIENQGIRKMRPEREILKNGEYAEIRKIRGHTKMLKTKISTDPGKSKESQKNKESKTKPREQKQMRTKPSKRHAKRQV